MEHFSPPYSRTLVFRVNILWGPLLDPTIVGTNCSEKSNIRKVHMLTMAAYEYFGVTRVRARLNFTWHKLTNHYNIINYSHICAHNLFVLIAGKLLSTCWPSAP